ncbi:TIGR02269 family lipoprotein [Pyxidicoccus sp. 3LFB2]
MRLSLLLLVAALQACATTTAQDAATGAAADVWDSAGQNECNGEDEGECLTATCTPAGCGIYRCEDLVPGRIVRTRGVPAMPPPANSQRNWGNSQPLPGDAHPVMVFQWYRPEELPSQQEFQRRLDEWRTRPHERHHIFPQALQQYFASRGINVHDWVLVIDAQVHARLHKEKDRGPWNTEWKHQHFEQASYMIARHNLWGLPLTYWQTLPPLPPP